MAKHAIASPSKFESIMLCAGKLAMEAGLPDTSSQYADEGTAAHFLGSTALTEGRPVAEYLGRWIEVGPEDCNWAVGPDAVAGNCFQVDDDMVAYIGTYVATVREIAKGGTLYVEQSLPIEHITGEEDAAGTADAVILLDDEIVIIDLKYGRGVLVDAVDNPQLKLYALGALEAFDVLCDFKRARLMIVQPRVADGISEWTIDIEELQRWGVEEASPAAARALSLIGTPVSWLPLTPGEAQCKFCKAKHKCPALAQRVQEEVGAEFEDMDKDTPARLHVDMEQADEAEGAAEFLATKMRAVDLIEDWCKAVRAEVERRLLAGAPVPGYKLVEGKRGHRKWSNDEEAEKALKGMRLKVEEMYDLKLISPTTAEKLAKAGAIGPRQWPRLQGLITQSEGKAHVAPESDKRPALTVAATVDQFDDISAEALA